MTVWVTALGVRLRIDVEDEVVERLTHEALIDVRDPAPGAEHLGVAVTGVGPWHVEAPAHSGSAETIEAVLAHVLTAVNLTAVAETPLLAFHAAVVSRAGETLVVPGRSGVGKSTLTACLLTRGWAYVSDEALALDWSTGDLSAYPRPMALTPWSCAAVGGATGIPAEGEMVVRPRDLGAAVERAPDAVRHVVLLERSSDTEVRLRPVLDRNVALEELLRRGFTHHRDGGRALQLLAGLLRGATVVRLSLGDPGRAADLLTLMVEQCRVEPARMVQA